jgi:hypothetical protein
MRSREGALVAAMFLLAAACTEPSTSPPARVGANASVRTGEKLRRVVITAPGAELAVGGALPLSSRMFFSRGGEMPGAPYVRWASSNACIAAVASGAASGTELRGVRRGTVDVIASFAGKADTIRVTVTGDSSAAAECEARRSTRADDESDGQPSARLGVRAGERVTRVVLFNEPGMLMRGDSLLLTSELWFSGGGRLRGPPRVRFASLDAAVARVDERTGWVRGVGSGPARITVRFAALADTIEVRVDE